MPDNHMEPLINYRPAMDKPNDSWTDEELRLGEWARARDRELRIEPLIDSRDELCDELRLYPSPERVYELCRVYIAAYERETADAE